MNFKSKSSLLIENIPITNFRAKFLYLFSCEDAAQQVLMSFVCLCVRVPSWNTFTVCKSILFQTIPECSRMFQNACRMFQCRMFWNVPECMQNVLECFRMHAECSRMNQKAYRMNEECSRMHAECSKMHAKCSKMNAESSRMNEECSSSQEICSAC